MMNIVQEILSCILRFSSQSVMVSTTTSANTYRAMCGTHRNFSNAAQLLIKGKLVYTMSLLVKQIMHVLLLVIFAYICSGEQVGCPWLPATPRRPPIKTQLQQFLWTIIYHHTSLRVIIIIHTITIEYKVMEVCYSNVMMRGHPFNQGGMC